jgi:L-malate glycosyltransferase
MAVVLIVQRRLPHYRVPLFCDLRDRLRARHIELRLLIGKPTRSELLKQDSGVLSWAEQLPTRYFGPLCWQPFSQQLRKAELVIVTQENRLLYNHWLLVRPRKFKLAFWGHGGNFQRSSRSGVSERFKSWTTRRADWWFAYTSLSVARIAATGFPEDQITNVENAADTATIVTQRASVQAPEIETLRRSLSLDGPVGVFIGSLYKEKRLAFLLESCLAIRKRVHNFHLVIMGAGPQYSTVTAWSRQYDWLRVLGPQSGLDKVRYAMLGEVFLNPGLVGLGILDSFAFELPLFTTNCGLHSPEIAYLQSGHNGMMTEDDVDAYANTVADFIQDRERLDVLKAGCRGSASRYTIENMSRRFALGVATALAA